MSVSISHIDTCMACYLTDHHNRDDEYLVGIAVDGATTVQEVRDMLESEIAGVEFPADITDEMILTALDDEFGPMCDSDKDGDGSTVLFDADLEVIDADDCGDSIQAWFLISWEE